MDALALVDRRILFAHLAIVPVVSIGPGRDDYQTHRASAEPVPASLQLPIEWLIEMTACCRPNRFHHNKGASVPQASVVACIFVGIFLGWFSTGITRGRGVGLIVNVVVAITSAIFGAWFLPDIARTTPFGHFAHMYPTPLATVDGAITAVIALWALRFVKRP